MRRGEPMIFNPWLEWTSGRNLFAASAVLLFASITGCSVLRTPQKDEGYLAYGIPTNITASFYGQGDGLHGEETASGEIFDKGGLTAAHKYLPFGTLLKVTNPKNNRSVKVRINDRGPYTGGRDLDLSAKAAEILGITNTGVASLIVEQVS